MALLAAVDEPVDLGADTSDALAFAATMGVDYLIIGASQRHAMAKLLRGSVATNFAQHLPESIRLVIFG